MRSNLFHLDTLHHCTLQCIYCRQIFSLNFDSLLQFANFACSQPFLNIYISVESIDFKLHLQRCFKTISNDGDSGPKFLGSISEKRPNPNCTVRVSMVIKIICLGVSQLHPFFIIFFLNTISYLQKEMNVLNMLITTTLVLFLMCIPAHEARRILHYVPYPTTGTGDMIPSSTISQKAFVVASRVDVSPFLQRRLLKATTNPSGPNSPTWIPSPVSQTRKTPPLQGSMQNSIPGSTSIPQVKENVKLKVQNPLHFKSILGFRFFYLIQQCTYYYIFSCHLFLYIFKFVISNL